MSNIPQNLCKYILLFIILDNSYFCLVPPRHFSLLYKKVEDSG